MNGFNIQRTDSRISADFEATIKLLEQLGQFQFMLAILGIIDEFTLMRLSS